MEDGTVYNKGGQTLHYWARDQKSSDGEREYF